MISVVVATFGTERWRRRALLAGESVKVEDGDEIVYEHQPEGTVATSRNGGAEKARNPWLLFLDADDALGRHFLLHMRRAVGQEPRSHPLLLTPAVSYIRNGRPTTPRLLRSVDHRRGNYLVIGTLIEREFFMAMGGFADEPRYGAWEDWHFWARCLEAGAQVVGVKQAVYRVTQDTSSRMRHASNQDRIRWHYEVGRDLFPDHYPASWLPSQMRVAERLDRVRARRRRR